MALPGTTSIHRAWTSPDRDNRIRVDVLLVEARANDFDALLLPGGVINPDALRIIPAAIAFIKVFVDAGKPIDTAKWKPNFGLGKIDAGQGGNRPAHINSLNDDSALNP